MLVRQAPQLRRLGILLLRGGDQLLRPSAAEMHDPEGHHVDRTIARVLVLDVGLLRAGKVGRRDATPGGDGRTIADDAPLAVYVSLSPIARELAEGHGYRVATTVEKRRQEACRLPLNATSWGTRAQGTKVTSMASDVLNPLPPGPIGSR